MDEFRRGLLLQMGENRSRTRRIRGPWFYGVAGTIAAGALLWLFALRLLPAGILVASWGMTLFRNSRVNGSERDRLLGQALVLAGTIVAALGAVRLSRGG